MVGLLTGGNAVHEKKWMGNLGAAPPAPNMPHAMLLKQKYIEQRWKRDDVQMRRRESAAKLRRSPSKVRAQVRQGLGAAAG